MTAIAIRLILPLDERSWQVDLLCLDRTVPVAGWRRAPGFAAVPQIWQIDYSTRRHIRRFAEGELYELPIGIK
jgi:hypothetical protein